ncbi:MAG: hypothetical protein GEU77_01015 [Deltaproteobacteria bacterium]|nr:hypothetical protein [Deltaproteobacteria bacterium]
MNDELIPHDVRQFVLDRIDSVAHLEALLLLRSKPDEEWSCETVANRLYIDQRQTAELLARLSADGFVTATVGQSSVYRYQPASMELQQMVDRLAEIYSKHLVPITNLIHSKPKTRVQEFADAFRLRKDK